LETKSLINGDYFHELTNFLNRKNLQIITALSQDIIYNSPYSNEKENFESVKYSLMEFRDWVDIYHANIKPMNPG